MSKAPIGIDDMKQEEKPQGERPKRCRRSELTRKEQKAPTKSKQWIGNTAGARPRAGEKKHRSQTAPAVHSRCNENRYFM